MPSIRAIATLTLSMVILGALPSIAWAHAGEAAIGNLGHGFAHPFAGLDHVLAMVAVGVLGAKFGGRALWALPGAFVTMMAGGGALAMAGLAFPMVETGVALSVLVLGALLALGWRMPVAAAMATVGLFALFHGQVHGMEAAGSSGLAYAAGFVVATGALHGAGVVFGVALARAHAAGQGLVRLAGAGMAVAGLGLAAALA